jgi:hypothetical protein
MTRFERWWRAAKPKWWRGDAPAEPAKAPPREPLKISRAAVDRFESMRPSGKPAVNPFVLPRPAPGVCPAADSPLMAQDAYPTSQVNSVYSWAGSTEHGLWSEGIGFMGYPYLAALAQRPEYRHPSEVMAEEMTRKWIVLRASGEEKNDKIKKLTAAMERFKLREAFRDATELEGLMGLAFIYPDFGDEDDAAELATKLTISSGKIAKGSLKRFTVIDPTWCSPNTYNSNNPLDPTFFRPQNWWVMGRVVHTSRLLTILSRPVPDILKPAYNFGGMSLSQMLKPYVDNWLRTRQSVSDLLNAFTVFTFETDMQSILGGGNGGDIDARIAMFTAMRNNMGLMTIDKNAEALSNVSAPLGTLDHLQAQSQEHMAAPARIPLVKLFGITPSGLNASSDGEIRTFYDSVKGRQERVYATALKTALDILQLNEFGSIDPGITFEFVSLWQLDEAAEAAVRKTKADEFAVFMDGGVVAPEEVRDVLATDPKSPFYGLSGPPPEPPEEPDDDAPGSEGETAREPRAEAESGV